MRRFVATEYGLAALLLVGLFVGLITMGLFWKFDWVGIRVEAVGLLFDIALFGIIISWFRSRWEKHERITHYYEELADIEAWRGAESYYRKVGITTRLKKRGESPPPLQLRGANLAGEDLNGANLIKADLVGANLSGANLIKAKLGGAKLDGANLSGANLIEAILDNAVFFKADLSGAKLGKAKLRKADLAGAKLDKADLFKADLFKADLSGADLSGANLIGANLIEVKNLTCTQLKIADNWESAYRDKKLACGAAIPDLK